jgi:hypothetical protein
MTITNAFQAIKQWIEFKTIEDYPELQGIPIYLRDDAEEITPPYIVFAETGAEEHEILRGVLNVSFEVRLVTVPGEDDQEAATADTHRELAAALQNITADTNSLAFLDGLAETKFFDIRGGVPMTENTDNQRITSIEHTMVVCPLR